MNRIKLVSFEMQMEFDIGDTDYNVVWGLDNNMEDVEKSLGKETGSIILDEPKEENELKDSFVEFKSVEEEEALKEQPSANPKQDDMEEKAKDEDIDQKEKVFGQHTDLFRESWGLPSKHQGDDTDKSSTGDEASVGISVKQTIEANGQKVEEEVIIPIDEEEEEKSLRFTTEVKIIRGKEKIDDKENIQEDDEDGEDKETLYKGALTKDEPDDKEKDTAVEKSIENSNLNDIFEDSTKVNYDENLEHQMMADEVWPIAEEDTPDIATGEDIMPEEAALDDHPRKFTLKLGAGPRSIKVSSQSLGLSGPPVFSQAVEGLEEEHLGDFGRAWAEAVSVCLERRMAAGHTLEEVMVELMEEMGLDKFRNIVEHFFGTLTVEQVDTEADTLEGEGADGV